VGWEGATHHILSHLAASGPSSLLLCQSSSACYHILGPSALCLPVVFAASIRFFSSTDPYPRCVHYLIAFCPLSTCWCLAAPPKVCVSHLALLRWLCTSLSCVHFEEMVNNEALERSGDGINKKLTGFNALAIKDNMKQFLVELNATIPRFKDQGTADWEQTRAKEPVSRAPRNGMILHRCIYSSSAN